LGTVILIRHARSVANSENILAGQTPGVRLDSVGVEQSKKLAEVLGELPITSVYVSPLERCMATIEPWLSKYGSQTPVHSDPRIIEPDYGRWSGRKLDELALDPLWNSVQNNPQEVIFPSGERFADVWERVKSFFETIKEVASGQENIIVVSHGDIIKFLIANLLNIEFQNFQTLSVEPASISIAILSKENSKLIQFNRSDEPISEVISKMLVPTLGGDQSTVQRGH
jgi:probable phosphomutase (TIGR03848 family)